MRNTDSEAEALVDNKWIKGHELRARWLGLSKRKVSKIRPEAAGTEIDLCKVESQVAETLRQVCLNPATGILRATIPGLDSFCKAVESLPLKASESPSGIEAQESRKEG